MASLGHVAIGLTAARIHEHGQRPGWRSALAWSALSMLPDADVIGFSLGLLATGVVVTHPLLDTMTDGGLGCALFWPSGLTRYFAPWRPIQVAPIGLGFLSPYGAIVAMSEIVLFLPLFVVALRTSNFKLQTSDFRLTRRCPCCGSPRHG